MWHEFLILSEEYTLRITNAKVAKKITEEINEVI
jgi:hypothetical protein